MTRPDWKKLGFLTPDALVAQRDTWGLLARLHTARAEVFDALAQRTAEPSWAATLAEATSSATRSAETLQAEAGEDGRLAAAEDSLLDQLLMGVDEILASGHVPSLLVCGHGPLGALARLPVELLGEVAGEHTRPLCAELLADESHALLARLFCMNAPPRAEADALRRLLRHLHGSLAEVLGARRQDLHALGVDGEWLAEQSRERVRAIHHALELRCTSADLGAVSRFG